MKNYEISAVQNGVPIGAVHRFLARTDKEACEDFDTFVENGNRWNDYTLCQVVKIKTSTSAERRQKRSK